MPRENRRKLDEGMPSKPKSVELAYEDKDTNQDDLGEYKEEEMAKRKWIKGAIKRPGALRAAARKAGALKNGISKTWLRAQAKAPGRRGRQARLAITLGRLRGHKRRR